MLANGDDKPIWMTEFGWSAAPPHVRVRRERGQEARRRDRGRPGEVPAPGDELHGGHPYVHGRDLVQQPRPRRRRQDGQHVRAAPLRRQPRPAYDAFRTWAAGGGRSGAAVRRLQRPRRADPRAAPSAVLPARLAALHPRQVRRRRPAPHPLPRPRLRPLPRRPADARARAGRRGRDHVEEAKQLPAGTHTLEVVAFDESGNAGRPRRSSSRRSGADAPGGQRPGRPVPERPAGRSGRSRTCAGGPLPGVLGGALRVEMDQAQERQAALGPRTTPRRERAPAVGLPPAPAFRGPGACASSTSASRRTG